MITPDDSRTRKTVKHRKAGNIIDDARTPARRLQRERPGGRTKANITASRKDAVKGIVRDGSRLRSGSQRLRDGGTRHTRINRHSRVIYDDYHNNVRHRHNRKHIYRDRHNRLHHRIIWPRYYYPVCYNWGFGFQFRYVYPYYHRKYVFVSLGGYWPSYSYARYYRYGCHPYEWYGYYPIAREVTGDTHNYYTYNYYTENEVDGVATGEIPYVDENTFADVREKLANEAEAGPDSETPADGYFDEAVVAFEEADYQKAADKLIRAMEYAPDDMVLPFAYSQALFADGNFSASAQALRGAMENVTPEKEGVFYPRGLYPNDEVLFEQIDLLAKKVRFGSFDADHQLVLGYQLLGIGKIEEAEEPLRQAMDAKNISAAAKLLNLLEKIKSQSGKGANN